MKIIAQTIQTYDGSVADNHQVGYLIEEPQRWLLVCWMLVCPHLLYQ